ncbi:MAG: ankyrin repeat domain-containing protein [Rhodocyclaceae bacterium]|nr:ankyrin repeat domain-containing protein [Rhodocyclaceae bacterium]
MHKTAPFAPRAIRLLSAVAVAGLSPAAIAADSPWSELQHTAQASCPRHAPLPRSLVDAAACGDLARVRARLVAGADLDATDPRPAFAGRNALHHAAHRGDAEIVASLLDAGADPNAIDVRGNTALHLLVTRPAGTDTVATLRRLLAFGADASLANEFGRTPRAELEAAAARGISPVRTDLAPLAQLLAQAEATGPIATAEPSMRRAAPTPSPAAGDTDGETPAVDTQPATAPEPAPEAAQAPAEAAEPVATESPAAAPGRNAESGLGWQSRPGPSAAEQTPAAADEGGGTAAAAGKVGASAEPALAWKPAPGPAADKAAPEIAEAATPTVDPAQPGTAETAPAPVPSAAAAAEAEPAEPRPAKNQVAADPQAAVQATLMRWAADWSAGDVDAYLAHYSGDFMPADGNTVESWRDQQRLRMGRSESIQIELNALDVAVKGDHAVARFVQDTRSEGHKVVSRKRLDLAREGADWRIVGEIDE